MKLSKKSIRVYVVIATWADGKYHLVHSGDKDDAISLAKTWRKVHTEAHVQTHEVYQAAGGEMNTKDALWIMLRAAEGASQVALSVWAMDADNKELTKAKELLQESHRKIRNMWVYCPEGEKLAGRMK